MGGFLLFASGGVSSCVISSEARNLFSRLRRFLVTLLLEMTLGDIPPSPATAKSFNVIIGVES